MRDFPALYDPIKHADPRYIAEQRAAAGEAAGAETQAQTAAAAASNPTPPPPPPPPPGYSGPTAYEEISGLLPSGFEQTLLPSSFADPFIGSALGAGRGAAQDFIENLFKRGGITSTGRETGLKAIGSQEPGVRGKLTDISNLLLEQGRAGLRGIAGEGYTEAGGQSGEFFDPTPFQQRAQTSASQFQEAFPSRYTSAVGDAGSFDTGSLAGLSGAATGPRNISLDPYAVEGGQLSTGLEEEPTPSGKKKTTSIF
jgi:hypothetical protein